jgi:putative Holliday junction resolvase
VQQKETTNPDELEDLGKLPARGRIVSIDPGTKRIGIAVTDEDRIVCRPLPVIERSSWKKLLSSIQAILTEFDAKALVIGLPLESDGSESPMSTEARDMARKFGLSLEIPVFLQDERNTSYAAKERLWAENGPQDLRGTVDSEAAAIILSDFLDRIP